MSCLDHSLSSSVLFRLLLSSDFSYVIGELMFQNRSGIVGAGQDDWFFAAIKSALRFSAWVGQVPCSVGFTIVFSQ